MSGRGLELTALALLALAAAVPRAAGAQDARHELAEHRRALATSDRRTDDTLFRLHELARLSETAPPAVAREARFLRAVASADRILLARWRREPLPVGLLEAWGGGPDRVVGAVRAELRALTRTAFADAAADVLAALEPDVGRALPPLGRGHVRQQMAFWAAVVDRVLRPRPDLGLLAALGSDPCGPGAADPCPEVHRPFGSRGRRAIAALTRLHAVLADLRRAAGEGDPFVDGLADQVVVDAAVLESVTLRPPDWAPTRTCARSEPVGRPVDADVAIVISEARVRVGVVPRVAWRGGEPELEEPGRPSLADAGNEGLAVRVSPLSLARPLAPLDELLERQLEGRERVAVLVEPGASAHLLTRVVVTLERRGVARITLATTGPDGVPHGVSVEPVHRDAVDRRAPARVYVRLGGFSVFLPGGFESLPRLREEPGQAWAFDMRGLERATRHAEGAPSVRYMSTVDAGLVSRVVSLVAPGDAPVRLMLP